MPPGYSATPSCNVGELVSTFERLIEQDIRKGILRREDQVHERYLHAFRQTLEADNAPSGLVELQPSTSQRNEETFAQDFGQGNPSTYGQFLLPSQNGSTMPFQNAETFLMLESTRNYEHHSIEELREQVQRMDSWQPRPSNTAPCIAATGPFDPKISTSSSFPQSTLSPWDEDPADPTDVQSQSSVNDFIGSEFDFEAVELMKSSALSLLESNRDPPLERDALNDNCQPNLDFLVDDTLFLDYLGLENEMQVDWNDKNSGNRALRQP